MRTRTRIGGSLAGSALLIGALAVATMAPALAQTDDGVAVPACPNAEACPNTEEEREARWDEREERRAERIGEQRGMGMGQGRDADRPGRGAGGAALQRRDGSMLEDGAVRLGRGPADGVGRGLGTGDCLSDAT